MGKPTPGPSEEGSRDATSFRHAMLSRHATTTHRGTPYCDNTSVVPPWLPLRFFAVLCVKPFVKPFSPCNSVPSVSPW